MFRIRHGACLAFAVALLAVLVVPAHAGPGYVNFMFGQKVFDSEDWALHVSRRSRHLGIRRRRQQDLDEGEALSISRSGRRLREGRFDRATGGHFVQRRRERIRFLGRWRRVLPARDAVQRRRHDPLQHRERRLQLVRHGECVIRRSGRRCGRRHVRLPSGLGMARHDPLNAARPRASPRTAGPASLSWL
jgi:hypothetical protein